MRKFIKLIPLQALFLVGSLTSCSANPNIVLEEYQEQYISSLEETGIKNVIMFIGDGMGVNIVDAGSIYKGETLIFDGEEFSYHAYMDTDSLSSEAFYLDETKSLLNPEENPSLYDGKKSPYDPDATLGTTGNATTYTDSAAGGTALSTGKRTTNGYIGMDQFGNNLTNLVEIANSLGKKTGVVSSDTLDGATPSSFLGHCNSRHDGAGIIDSIVASTPADLILTTQSSYHTSTHDQSFKNKGYSIATSLTELDKSSNKILGKFPGIIPFKDYRDVPTLTDLTTFSLDYLDNENGFFLMVEGAKIDKRAHEHQTKLVINELLGFEESVRAAYEWAKGRNDTLIIVTADHETGGYYFDRNTATKENIVEISNWKTYNHSRTRVDLKTNIDISPFINKHGENLRTLEGKPYWKNTDVFNLAVSYL